MIGIIGAMDEEVEQIVAVMDIEREETKAQMTFKAGKLAGKDVVIIDPSPAVARFLVQRLTEEGSLRKAAGRTAVSRFWCTGNPDDRTETLQKLWSPEVRMESLEDAWPPLRDAL